MDMQTHTKMSLYETLSVVTHTIQRLRTYSKGNKNDIFGDGTNWTKGVLINNIVYIMLCDNKWHNGAICSHLLAIIGSTFYRKQWRWMKDHQIHRLSINDYTKIAKKAHEIVRRTGVD